MRSETLPAYAKDYVFAFGGMKDGRAVKSVERYSIKADMWMVLPELNIARANASGIVMLDYLYVFGGKDQAFINTIERLNLKNISSKFEVIDVVLPVGASDIGLVPLVQSGHSAEVMLLGGFNG
jgi:hypothetical protein